MKKKNLPILIVVLLIILVGAAGTAVYFIQKYTPTKETMSASEYYGVGENGTEIPLIFGTEILEQKGICIDEEVFVSEDVITDYLNKRFLLGQQRKYFDLHDSDGKVYHRTRDKCL